MIFLTVIPSEATVGIGTAENNRKFHSELDLSTCGIPQDIWALQWYGTHGHIEHTNGAGNLSIDALPSWANACIEVWNAEQNKPVVVTLDDIKYRADTLLVISDWSVLPDVNLVNQSDWIAYRQQLRTIRSNPTLDAEFPEVPAKIWS